MNSGITERYRVQPHLKKCFEGIDRLKFNEDLDVLGMTSTEDEEVDLIEIISTSAARGQVEKWLLELEAIMRRSVRHVVHQAIKAYPTKPRKVWVLEWPGQTILCVGKMYWTLRIEKSMLDGVPGMNKYLNQCQEELNDIIAIVRGKMSKQNRITLGDYTACSSLLHSIENYNRYEFQRLLSRWTYTGGTCSQNFAMKR